MAFVVSVSSALLVELALLPALLSLIFSTCFFPLCWNVLLRQDEFFLPCDAFTVSILAFFGKPLDFCVDILR